MTNIFNEWIDVNDRLPSIDKSGKNLHELFEVKDSSGDTYTCYYGCGMFSLNYSFYDEYIIKDVTHWRKIGEV